MDTSSEIDIEKIQNKIKEKVDRNVEKLETSVLAVYRQRNESRENPGQIGTAFIIKHKNTQYLITAHHVFQHASNEGAPVFLSKKGSFFDLDQIKDESASEIFNEDLDFYIIKTKNNPAGIDGIPVEEQEPQEQYKLCLTIGYPNSRNKKRIDIANQRANSTSTRLTLSNQKETGEILSAEANCPYFLMAWEKKALNENWDKVDAIGIRGMSGAPCFKIPFGKEDVIYNVDPYLGVKLVGLLIENKNDAIKFIKLSEIIRFLPCV
ncbi:MAG: trypsin-like peptidase domain-containing protein [Alcaligenes sp.]